MMQSSSGKQSGERDAGYEKKGEIRRTDSGRGPRAKKKVLLEERGRSVR